MLIEWSLVRVQPIPNKYEERKMTVKIHEEHKDIKLMIPITAENIDFILEKCYAVSFEKIGYKDVTSASVSIGIGEYYLSGRVSLGHIVLDSQHSGEYCNCESGIHSLMKKFKGSGIIEETGEEGEFEVIKYVDGKIKRGRMVFED